MNKNLEKNLIEKFTDLYKNTSMERGIECEDGWYDIIYNLSCEIKYWSDQNKLKIKALQVKEKSGVLRFHIALHDDSPLWNDTQYKEISQIICKHEEISAKTCELTGNIGSLKIKDQQYKTLCKESAILLGYNDVKKQILY